MSASSTKSSFLERRLAGEQQVLARPLRALVKRAPVTCAPHATVREAVRLMHAKGVGSIVVVDGTGAPVGIFTTTDLVAASAREGESRAVEESMATQPFTLPSHAMAYEAALAMIAMKIRHVLVMDGDALAGIVSIGDVVKHRLEEAMRTEQDLHDYISGTYYH